MPLEIDGVYFLAELKDLCNKYHLAISGFEIGEVVSSASVAGFTMNEEISNTKLFPVMEVMDD